MDHMGHVGEPGNAGLGQDTRTGGVRALEPEGLLEKNGILLLL